MQPETSGASSARVDDVRPNSGPMTLRLDDEMVRAAQAYRRGRIEHAGSGDQYGPVTTAFDLAAHSLAALLADKIVDADVEQFLADLSESSVTYAEIERDREHRQPRRSWRRR